jgi:hypothetical protein
MQMFIKCNHCGACCATSEEFDRESKAGIWFIGLTPDGWTWEWVHSCESKAKWLPEDFIMEV